VEIEVQDSLKMTRGTYAQLGMEGITGISYVHLLDDGKDKTPLPADGVPDIVLKPSMLDELFDSAGGVTSGVKEVLASVQKVLNAENRENAAAALASLRTVTANLEVASRRLPGTLERADGFFSEQNRRNVSETLASVQASTRDMPELAREAKAMVLEARRLTESVNTLALEARGATADVRHETLPRAHALAESVERGAERIGRLAYELERHPESVLWGRSPSRPGPGEAGFE
jgi:phospholipid/cholesterol/gamma-HCH transport system substrate-binding protein